MRLWLPTFFGARVDRSITTISSWPGLPSLPVLGPALPPDSLTSSTTFQLSPVDFTYFPDLRSVHARLLQHQRSDTATRVIPLETPQRHTPSKQSISRAHPAALLWSLDGTLRTELNTLTPIPRKGSKQTAALSKSFSAFHPFYNITRPKVAKRRSKCASLGLTSRRSHAAIAGTNSSALAIPPTISPTAQKGLKSKAGRRGTIHVPGATATAK
jgi:hypothetical protein